MSGYPIGTGDYWAMKHHRWWLERGRLEAEMHPCKPVPWPVQNDANYSQPMQRRPP